MDITDIRIRKTYDESRLKALVSVTFDSVFVVHDIKIIQGDERYFVAMPSRRDENGLFRDIAHPISPEMRWKIETSLIEKYHEALDNTTPSAFIPEQAQS